MGGGLQESEPEGGIGVDKSGKTDDFDKYLGDLAGEFQTLHGKDDLGVEDGFERFQGLNLVGLQGLTEPDQGDQKRERESMDGLPQICEDVPADDVDAWLETLRQGKLLPPHVIQFVCTRLTYLLAGDSNVHNISSPVTVVGDVHGQFYDVLEIFKIAGPVPNTNYLFLGDYVDRGAFSVETISFLACLKLRHPNRISLIRGNHESRQTTMTYGFYQECMKKYGNSAVWTWFMDMFDYLPLAALIDDEVFGTHGGLSPSIHTIDQIRVLDRIQEIPHHGPVCDLMWADPDTDNNDGFKESWRGAGYTFGEDELRKFNHINGLSYFLRAHQLCMEGYQELWGCFATVWSAPNYCYRFGNLAALAHISSHDKPQFTVFEAAPANARKPKDAKITKMTWFTEDVPL